MGRSAHRHCVAAGPSRSGRPIGPGPRAAEARPGFCRIKHMNCRHCGHSLEHVFLDLGHAPPSNAYLDAASLDAPEVTFPLKLYVCECCWLVQTEDFARADQLFASDYAYFSSTSQTWRDHATRYFEMVRAKFELDSLSLVLEVASNDGYLLRHFLSAGIPCLGIEPTASTAKAA